MVLFYHPDEMHACSVSQYFEKENQNGLYVPYKFSSPGTTSPDSRLRQKAIQSGCSQIVTIHSDDLYSLNCALYIFSFKKRYREIGKELRDKFNGDYGFYTSGSTRQIQIDLELNESNTVDLSVGIVKELLHLLTE